MKLSPLQEEALHLLRAFVGYTDDAMLLVNLGPRRRVIMAALCRRGLAKWLSSAERWAITSDGLAWLKANDLKEVQP